MNSGPVMLAAHRLYARLGFRRLPERDIVITENGRPLTLFTFGLDLDADIDHHPHPRSSGEIEGSE